MQITKAELDNIIRKSVAATVELLEERGLLGSASASSDASASSKSKGGRKSKNASASSQKPEKNAYQRTEQLLFNYNNFKKIVEERKQKIEEIKLYGVPQRGSAVVVYSGDLCGKPDMKTEDEKKQDEIYRIEKSMETTVQALALIDEGMGKLKTDPYYLILEMQYFEGRTQEDMATHFNCSQQNIAYHKNRLVRELSIKLFPDRVVWESMG